MTRPRLNFIVDAILFVLLAGIVFMGILLGWAMDTGPQGTKVFWSLHRHQWGDIHLWLSVAFLAALVVHLVLHWKWIAGAARRILGRSWRLIPLALAPALLVWMLWSLQGETPAYGRGAGMGTGRGPDKVACAREGQRRMRKRRGGKAWNQPLSQHRRPGYDRARHGQSRGKRACPQGR